MRHLTAILLALGFLTSSAHAAPVRDASQRLNALRLTPQQSIPSVTRARPSVYKPVRFSMEIGDHAGRGPTIADVKINQGLDGRTPAQALAKVRSMLTTKVAPANQRFVDQTILDTHKSFTVAVNNAFTAGSPSNKLLTGELAGAKVSILGVMSAVRPTILMAKKPGEARSRFYAVGQGGTYEELPKLPYSVIMKASLEDGAKGGVRLTYHTWSNERLGGPLSTVTELGSSGSP